MADAKPSKAAWPSKARSEAREQHSLLVRRDPRVIACCDVYTESGFILRTITLIRERVGNDYSYELWSSDKGFAMGTVSREYALGCYSFFVDIALKERVKE